MLSRVSYRIVTHTIASRACTASHRSRTVPYCPFHRCNAQSQTYSISSCGAVPWSRALTSALGGTVLRVSWLLSARAGRSQTPCFTLYARVPRVFAGFHIHEVWRLHLVLPSLLRRMPGMHSFTGLHCRYTFAKACLYSQHRDAEA